MRFGILGATGAWRADGRPVALGGPRLRALLARLLLDPGRTVPVARLIDDLYGETAPKGAANALQSQVSRLRHALPASPVQLGPGGYRLVVDPEQVDAHRFGRLAAEGRRALAAGDHRTAADLLARALALWRGPALADVTDAPFAPAAAARWEEERLAAIEDHAEARLALGEAGPLASELRELVTAHPLRERLRALLVRALYAGGRAADALAVFEEGRRRLADELGVDPSPELAAAHRAVLRREPAHPALAATPPAAPAPPARAAARPDEPVAGVAAPALPAQLTSFVGREEELRRVGALLAQGRLVTVTGAGGVGKTRLALEAAARHGGEVRFVALDPVPTGAEVPQAVLAALGLRDAGLREAADRRPDPVERLLAALADRRVLLVLDNCEHVVADVARLAVRLLGGCPELRILATSRQALGVTGEALCPLPGLAVPPADASAAVALAYPAVRLLAERAGDVVPGFTVDDANVASVVRICRMLDGLPLAIELAAARLRVLSPAEVAARLDDRFRLLSRGSRAAQPRHQTLRAVVEWSWDLLDEAEQTLARRLTVFAGGASLAAVERVCGVPADDAMDLLTGLVDKSLVDATGGRFRMLETIRAFGAERLAEAGETERLYRAHAAYFLELAETADPHLRRAEQLEWLARLDVERDNLHAALRRATAAGDWDTALRLVSALSFYWWLRGLRGEATHLAHELRAAVGAAPAGREEEFLLCELLESLGQLGRIGAERGHVVSEARHVSRQPFLFYLSAIASGPPTDDLEALLAMVEQVQRAGTDPWIQALSPVGVGLLLVMRGEAGRAEALLADALSRFQVLGDRWGSMMALSAMAEVADARGDRRRASARWEEALGLAEELGSTVDVTELLNTRGLAHLRPGGDLDVAERDLTRALELARRAGAPEQVAAARYGLAEAARLRGDLAGARRLAERALAECPAGWFTVEAIRASIHLCLGRIAEASGDVAAARESYRRTVAVSRPWWNWPEEAEAAAALRRLEVGGPGA